MNTRARIASRLIVLAACFVAACHVEDPSDRAIEHASDTASDPAAASPGGGAVSAEMRSGGAGVTLTSHTTPVATDWATIQSIVAARADSTDHMLRKVRALTRWEQVKLRRDVNLLQIARARQLGITPGTDFDQLVRTHRLVQLEDNTQYWILHNLNFSVPYVVPGTESLLAEIAQRFQTNLDSLGVPRYRLVITSVLRTPDKQVALRKANANASKIESAHEFGTTVDIAYRRFAAPVDSTLDGSGLLLGDSVMVKTANTRSAELQAVLGRVLSEMQAEGKVMVMMERHQTVYHITLGQALPPRHIAAL